MRIARPKPAETVFKRKRGPPPQATKLLLSSLAAGLIFMGLLAVVFVPRYLENLDQPPVAVLSICPFWVNASVRLELVAASVSLPLSTFNASLLQGNVTIASLPAGMAGGNATFRFVDANGDLALDAGDYFTVGLAAQASYQLQVWQRDVGRLVGVYSSWQGPLSQCLTNGGS